MATKKKKFSIRNPIAIKAKARKITTIKHRLEPRKGSKNDQPELLNMASEHHTQEDINHCNNGVECFANYEDKHICNCHCDICAGVDEFVEDYEF